MVDQNKQEVKCKINKIDTTNDILSGRGGLAFIVRFIDRLGITKIFHSWVRHHGHEQQ